MTTLSPELEALIAGMERPDTYIHNQAALYKDVLTLIAALRSQAERVGDLESTENKSIDKFSSLAEENLRLCGELGSLQDASEQIIVELELEIAALRKELKWYGEQSRLARLIHSEGDAGRHALSQDGGKRARAVLMSDD